MKKYITKSIHRLVLEAFKGRCPENMEASHIDGDRNNDRLENLKWESHRENVARIDQSKLKHLRARKGSKNGRAKLTEEIVLKIRALHKTGEYSQNQLARIFNISQTTIWRLSNEGGWAHV